MVSCLPKYIQSGKHVDWLPGLRWVPRRWTSFCWPMPPWKVIGNTEPEWIGMQENYPLASDHQERDCQAVCWEISTRELLVYAPVPPRPKDRWGINWHILSVFCLPLGARVPCFFAITAALGSLGAWHFNIGAKPDVTYPTRQDTNWHWAFPEVSFTRA